MDIIPHLRFVLGEDVVTDPIWEWINSLESSRGSDVGLNLNNNNDEMHDPSCGSALSGVLPNELATTSSHAIGFEFLDQFEDGGDGTRNTIDNSLLSMLEPPYDSLYHSNPMSTDDPDTSRDPFASWHWSDVSPTGTTTTADSSPDWLLGNDQSHDNLSTIKNLDDPPYTPNNDLAQLDTECPDYAVEVCVPNSHDMLPEIVYPNLGHVMVGMDPDANLSPTRSPFSAVPIQHKRASRPKNKHFCVECGRGFRDRTNLRVHQLIHEGKKPFGCAFVGCGKFFRQKAHRDKHYMSKIHQGLQLPAIDE